jgi:hypothetical protein
MFIASHALTAPAAYVSRIHYTAHYQYAVAACPEIPHPDHLEGHTLVDSITGGPNEFSQVQQVTFTVPVLMPWRTLEFTPDSNHRVTVQTRALGAVRHAPSKMRGRSS